MSYPIKRLFVDTETTGTDEKIHGLHQISGCIEIDGIVKEEFDFNVKPFEGAIIEDEALAIGGVTREQIQSYEEESIIYNKLLTLILKYVNKFDKKDKLLVIGYNVKFDTNFLYQFWLRQGDNYLFSLIWGNQLDVLSMASFLLEKERPSMVNFKLMTVAQKMGIVIDEEKLHNSYYDIVVTRELFYLVSDKLSGIFPNVVVDTPAKSIATEFMPGNNIDVPKTQKLPEEPKPKSLRKISDLNHIIDFGKYKYQNKTIGQILATDAQYLIWIHDGTIQGYKFSNDIMTDAIREAEKQKKEYLAGKSSYDKPKKYSGGNSSGGSSDDVFSGSMGTALDEDIDRNMFSDWEGDDECPF